MLVLYLFSNVPQSLLALHAVGILFGVLIGGAGVGLIAWAGNNPDKDPLWETNSPKEISRCGIFLLILGIAGFLAGIYPWFLVITAAIFIGLWRFVKGIRVAKLGQLLK